MNPENEAPETEDTAPPTDKMTDWQRQDNRGKAIKAALELGGHASVRDLLDAARQIADFVETGSPTTK